uniref:Death domain-containing protein n=1 Tax=Amphimedon queenslandica TaxID=400682 RepID=A0A1X7TZM0_AMPQE
MDRKPEVSELLEWLDELSRWKKFGMFLPGIRPHDLDIIEDEENRADNRKIALFGKWLRVYPEANWGHVIDALEKANEKELVKKVKEKLRILPVAKAGEEMVDGQEEADKEEMVDVN